MKTPTIINSPVLGNLMLWSAFEKTVAEKLMNEIVAAAGKQSKLAKELLVKELLDNKLSADKLKLLYNEYHTSHDKLILHPQWSFNSDNPLDPEYYSHKLRNEINQRLNGYAISFTPFFSNSDVREMSDFLDLYHELIMGIIRNINKIIVDTDSKHNILVNIDVLESLSANASIESKIFQQGYEEIGYAFSKEAELELDEIFMFLSGGLTRELKRIKGSKDEIISVQKFQGILSSLKGFTTILKKCSDELAEQTIDRIKDSIFPAKEIAVIIDMLTTSFVVEDIRKHIALLEGKGMESFPDQVFTLHPNINDKFLISLHKRLQGKGYISSDQKTFIEFIKAKQFGASQKLIWDGSYEELWCFLQCMFKNVLKIPYELNFNIEEWSKEDSEVDSSNCKKKFSTWLNKMLKSRIAMKTADGGFKKKEMHDLKNYRNKKQDSIRDDFYTLIYS